MDMDMDLKVINCNFEQNNAPYGGAVQLKGKNIEIALLLFITVILFGVIVSLTSLLIAEREQQYFSVSDIFKLIGFAIIENFGVRQLISLWRVGGQLSIVFGKGGWGQVKRKGQKNE